MSDKQLPAETIATEASASEAAKWKQLAWLPCTLSLELPLAHFTIRELLQLRRGGIVSTAWSRGTEVPLRANGQLIGWAEFEPVGGQVGARITELV